MKASGITTTSTGAWFPNSVADPNQFLGWRGLAATTNHFARESHMDDLATAAKMDPLEFRLKNISDERLRNVFQAAAKSFGWPAKKTKPGQGFGIGGDRKKTVTSRRLQKSQ